MTGALLSYGTTQLLADRTMASAIGNASRRAIAAGMMFGTPLWQCPMLYSNFMSDTQLGQQAAHLHILGEETRVNLLGP